MFWRTKEPAQEPKVNPETILHTVKGRVEQVADSYERHCFHILVRKEDGEYLAFRAEYSMTQAPLARVGDFVEVKFWLRDNGKYVQLNSFEIDFAKRRKEE